MQIELKHGAGGAATDALIGSLFAKYFQNEVLSRMEDGAVLPELAGSPVLTTDSFVVTPLFFPGGDIGRLAVCGTVNDLACMGARPLYLTAAFILEEGLPMALLERVVKQLFSLFNGLTHGIQVKRLRLTISIQAAKDSQGLILGGGGKGKERDVILPPSCCA